MCGAFGTFARRAYAVCRSGPVSSNVRPQERQVHCIFQNLLKPYSFRAYFSQLRMLNKPKHSRATPDSHDVLVMKVKAALVSDVPTLFKHWKQRFGRAY